MLHPLKNTVLEDIDKALLRELQADGCIAAGVG